MLIRALQDNAEAIASRGRKCIEAAKAVGVSAIYAHPDDGRLVEEMPDGTIVDFVPPVDIGGEHPGPRA